MATLFSSCDAEVINRKVEVAEVECLSSSNLEDFYEIDRCVKWITENKLKNIALQFPDEMLCESVQIASIIKRKTNSEVYILGDTSYGSCCVDEIAAEHVSADSLIHFGHSCLSPTQRLPILYVYGHKSIDVCHVEETVSQLIQNQNENLILVYDVVYAHAADELQKKLSSIYNNLISSQMETTSAEFDESKFNIVKKLGRVIPIPDDHRLDDYAFLFIGNDNATLSNFILTFNRNTFYSYDPKLRTARREQLHVNKTLMKRYYLAEKTRDANIIGILVGTLGIIDYLSIISHLKKIIRKAGKKAYTLAMGKINVAKLANFPEVDVFVLVACPENSIIDSKDFFRPVVTPYEVEIACNSERTWTGDYITDFRELLPGASSYVEAVDNPDKDDEISISLITGSVRRVNFNENDSNSFTVMERNESRALAAVHQNAAGEFLSNRSWTGLQQKLGETEVVKAKKGRIGIASTYENEKDILKVD